MERIQNLADVGTAQGALPVQLALAHKHLSGIGFDLAVCGPVFEEYVHSFRLSDRLRFQAGSFPEDPLPEADVLIMGHILHGESLDDKRALIQKVYKVLPKGGAYIIFEELIDDERRKNALALLMSLNILVETPGGFNATASDYSGWIREAGFRKIHTEHLAGPVSMLVGSK